LIAQRINERRTLVDAGRPVSTIADGSPKARLFAAGPAPI
jgi:hypothetical protein